MRFFQKKPKRVYLDHAAATPLDLDVQNAMKPYLSELFFNPSALYKESVKVKESFDGLRKRVGSVLRVLPQEIIFTNGGTESLNLALMGVVKAFHSAHPDKKPHVVVSAIEHPGILVTARELYQRKEIELTELPVNESGIVDMQTLKESLQENTVLVSVMYANNEIGAIQPVREIAKTVRWFKKHRMNDANAIYPLVHTDAIQATNYLDIQVPHLGVDLMTISAAKIYGPKGIASLFVKKGTPIESVLYGGGQERGLRSGTENMLAIAGFVTALEKAVALREKESARLADLQKYFFKKLKPLNVTVNGGMSERLPNNINISIPKVSGERLVIELDARGVLCSAQSACSSHDDAESYVVKALRPDANIEEGSLRFTMGQSTTKKDIDFTVKQLETILEKIQKTQKKFV